MYSNEKPPVVLFPSPSPIENKIVQNTKNDQIEYVPFPYQEFPVLIYKSKNNPPLHLASNQNTQNNSEISNFDKRFGQALTGSERTSRAIKSWSQFNELLNKNSGLFKPSDSNKEFISKSQKYISINNDLLNSTFENQNKLNYPHAVYTGHPPIHIFPQPIIIKGKDSEFGEETSASESNGLYVSYKDSKNKNEIENSSSETSETSQAIPSSQGSSSSGMKNIDNRVETGGNKYYGEYPSDFDEAQSQSTQYSEDPYESESERGEDERYSKNSDEAKEFDKEAKSQYRDSNYKIRYREKYNPYSTLWDPEVDYAWLSALFGGNYAKWPKYKRTYPYGAASSDALSYANLNSDFDNMALLNQAMRQPNWLSMYNSNPMYSANSMYSTNSMYNTNPMYSSNYYRPSPSAVRPTYTLNNLLSYRPRHNAIPSTPYYSRYNPTYGYSTSPSTLSQANLRPLMYNPSLLGLPSLSYPVKVPLTSYPMYRYRPVTYGYGNSYGNGFSNLHHNSNGDLAFAESNTKLNVSKYMKKYSNDFDEMIGSASHTSPSFSIAPPNQNSQQTIKKPPIIIYQGIRPPIHVYHQSNAQNNLNSDVNVNEIKTSNEAIEVSTEQNTENPYSQFFTEQPKANHENKLYFSRSAEFTPRNSIKDNWTPIKQINSSSN